MDEIIVLRHEELVAFKKELLSGMRVLLKEGMEKQSQQEWLDNIGAQEYLGVKRTTLYKLRRDGKIPFTQRERKIIRGGENIYPREIEEFLHGHPAIDYVQVIGIPDEKYGEEVMAWIRLKPGTALTEEEIIAYCKGNIAHYKIPKYIDFTDAFPMTVTGKIRKVEMREISIREMGLVAVDG